MKGRYKALQELKKTERNQLKNKILRLEQQAEKTANTVNSLKKDAAANRLGKKQLIKYRDLKKKLYYKHQRIQKFRDRLVQLEKDMENGRYSFGFGGKKTFDDQYRLLENGYRSHEGWYNDYRRKRDRNIFYLGSRDETAGISGYARMENTIPTAGMFTGNAVLNILMMSSGKVSKIGTGPCRIVSRCGERRSTCRRS